MKAIIFKEIIQLIEIGLRSNLKSEKHSCLHRIGKNLNLLVGSPVINLDKIKEEQEETEKMSSLRGEMKLLITKFGQIVNWKAKLATKENEIKIREELLILTEKFARDYYKLQSRYLNLMFAQDLEKIIGKEKAELFLRISKEQ